MNYVADLANGNKHCNKSIVFKLTVLYILHANPLLHVNSTYSALDWPVNIGNGPVAQIGCTKLGGQPTMWAVDHVHPQHPPKRIGTMS